MRKTAVFVMVLSLMLMFCACGGKDQTPPINDNKQETEETVKSADRLEGYWICEGGTSKFKFEITELALGEYGGEVSNMNDTTEISSYYVEGENVYVDGKLRYYFDGTYLYPIYGKKLTFNDDGYLEGKLEYEYGNYSTRFNFTGDGEFEYYASYNDSYYFEDVPYEIDNGFVIITFYKGRFESPITIKRIIYDDQVFDYYYKRA